MKTSKIGIRIVAMVVMMTTVSCNEFLTVEPDSYSKPDSFYKNVTEAEIALAGIYNRFAQENAFGHHIIMFDGSNDEGFYNNRNNESWSVGLYRYNSSDKYITGLWSAMHEAINLSNLMIEKLKPGNFEEAGVFEALLAEARFLRGFAYLTLTSWFDQVPLRAKSTKTQADNNMPASELKDVYAFIVNDLSFAAKYLPHAKDASYVQGRANKMAAHGLLARMYLKMAGYPHKDHNAYALALAHCDTIINVDGWHNLNTTGSKVAADNGYRNHFLSYIQNVYDTKESLFEISFTYLRNMGLMTDGRHGALNGLRFWMKGGLEGPSAYSQYAVSPVVEYAYETGDLRKDWNIPGYQYTYDDGKKIGDAKPTKLLDQYHTPGKFRRWEITDPALLASSPTVNGTVEPYTVLEKAAAFSPNFTCVNLPIVRYADVLLMYAEAANELDDMPTAIAALNKVRDRAALADISTAKPAAIASKSAFFNELVDERMRELCFEGGRHFDLVRWGLLGARLTKLNSLLKGTPGFSDKNEQHKSYLRSQENFNEAKHLSLPYPLQEITINKSLKQKAAWSNE